MEISVVVTIYNAGTVIPELIKRIKDSLSSFTNDYEIILIEDRGGDNSWQLLKEAALKDKRIKVARMARNFGQHSAISAGLTMATGNYVILMDGDLQDKPEVIPELYKKIKETNKEIIYVKRINRKDSEFKKRTSRTFYKLFSKFSGIKTDPSVGTYRIMTKLVCESFCQFKEVNKYVGGIFYWMNFDSDYHEAEHQQRLVGKSNYNLNKLLRLAFNGMLSFSNKPLNLAIYLGFISSFGSILLGIYFILRKFILHVNVTGYSSLIVSIYFIGGLILFVLGIIGQYIGRIYDQSKARPEYILQEKINFD
jgi:dolichol-phosphate mannosyltransferase